MAGGLPRNFEVHLVGPSATALVPAVLQVREEGVSFYKRKPAEQPVGDAVKGKPLFRYKLEQLRGWNAPDQRSFVVEIATHNGPKEIRLKVCGPTQHPPHADQQQQQQQQLTHEQR